MITSKIFTAWFRALRPAQWLKNGIVPAALFFAWWDPTQNLAPQGFLAFLKACLATACFCMGSSAIYLMNDLRDIDADRLHPVKRLRPIAAGELPRTAGCIMAVVLAISAIAFSTALPRAFTLVLGAYLAMQVSYTFFLKRITYVDVFVIAIGFVLRAVAGATAIQVRISPWLLLCTFLLALFLALCKRRHEKLLLESGGVEHRVALSGYDPTLLNMQIAIIASATIVCYSIYTLAVDTVQRFNTSNLALTIPFVVFGVFRYLHLVYQNEEGGRPEKVMLTDRILIVTVLAYLVVTGIIFLYCH